MSSRRVRTEFEALVQCAPAEREARLRELATTDHRLADEVRELLRQDATAGRFLERHAAPDRAAASAGQRFGRYELVRLLGQGGMGSVWEAVQREPDRRVALKLVAGLRTPEQRWRFAQEAQVLASLQHPAIATLYDSGLTDGTDGDVAWLAMELVDGASDVLRWADARHLGRDARLALLLRLCDAVAHGHRRGVLHRDLKADNVLVDRHGALKLIDFGIARVAGDGQGDGAPRTRTGALLGTLQAMAPEQLRGDGRAIGTATDVHALGVLGYELLCGRPPYDVAGTSWAETARILLEHEPRPPRSVRPDLPDDLAWILLRCLAKDPGARYPTVDALVDDIARFQAHLPVRAHAPSVLARAGKFVRRHRVGVAFATTLIAGLAVGGYGLWRGELEARAGERAAVVARGQAQQQAAAAQRAEAQAREVLRVTFGLFEAIEDTEASRDLQVHELLARARLDERATADPAVEQQVRIVRGNAYDRLHRYPEARAEYERARALQPAVQAAAGADAAAHRDEGLALDATLGRLLVHTNDRARGETLLRDAVQALPGIGAPTQARVLRTWCRFLAEENRNPELLDAVARLRAVPGVDSDRELAVQIDRWTAEAASALERHDEAKAAAAAGLAAARSVYGDDHWTACALLATQVSVLHRAGDLDAAEAAYPELLARTRAVYGDQHPNVLMTLNNQAHLLMSRGKRDAAIDALRSVVGVYEARGGAMTTEHLTALHNLGMALNMTGKHADAEPLLARAAAASRTLCGEQNPEGPMMRFNHGACLAWLKRWSEAEPVLLTEYDALVALLPANHPVLGKAKRTLRDAFRVNGTSDALPERLR